MSAIYDRVALIGLGLIASSMSHAIRRHGLAREIVGTARSAETRRVAMEIGQERGAGGDFHGHGQFDEVVLPDHRREPPFDGHREGEFLGAVFLANFEGGNCRNCPPERGRCRYFR